MPEITSMSGQISNTVYGGVTMVVNGSGFTGASRVHFRDQNLKEYDVASYTVDSDSQITLTTPRVNEPGTYHVYVTVNGQKSTTPSVDALAADGDGMAGTGTFGVTLTTKPSDANRLQISAISTYDQLSQAFGSR